MDETLQPGTTTAAATPAPVAPAAQERADAAQVAADITDLCVRHGVPQMASGMIRAGRTIDQANAAVLAELATRDAASGGHRNVSRIDTVRDEMSTRMAGIEQAILHRIAPNTTLDDNGRSYRGMSLLEIGRQFLEAHGQQTRGIDRVTLAGRILHFRAGGMHTTGDFSSLFANVANKRLRGAYDENPGTYSMWARRAPNAPDFKNISVVQLSGAPSRLSRTSNRTAAWLPGCWLLVSRSWPCWPRIGRPCRSRPWRTARSCCRTSGWTAWPCCPSRRSWPATRPRSSCASTWSAGWRRGGWRWARGSASGEDAPETRSCSRARGHGWASSCWWCRRYPSSRMQSHSTHTGLHHPGCNCWPKTR